MFVPTVMQPIEHAEKFVFTILGRDQSQHKICDVIFTRKSLLVTLPCFGSTIVAVKSIPPHREPTTLDLADGGKVLSRRHIHYTHYYATGDAHFSGDGKIFTKIERRAFPLTEAQGHIFSIYLKGLEQFELLRGNPEPTTKRVTFGFGVDSVAADSFKIVGEWRKGVPAAFLSRQFYRLMHVPPIHRIAPPQGWPMDDHVLTISCDTIPPFSEEEVKFAFIGGFDSPSTVYGVSENAQTLCLLSPIPNYDEVAKRIGSIDFNP